MSTKLIADLITILSSYLYGWRTPSPMSRVCCLPPRRPDGRRGVGKRLERTQITTYVGPRKKQKDAGMTGVPGQVSGRKILSSPLDAPTAGHHALDSYHRPQVTHHRYLSVAWPACALADLHPCSLHAEPCRRYTRALPMFSPGSFLSRRGVRMIRDAQS